MMLADPEGFHDPLERADHVVRMHFLQDQLRCAQLTSGLRGALISQAKRQVQDCLVAWESDDWDEVCRSRQIRDAQELVRAQVDTLGRYMRDAARTRAWDQIHVQCRPHAAPGSVYADTQRLREALWDCALATVDWDQIVAALPVGKCDEHVCEPPHPTYQSLYWAMVRRQIGAQVLGLDEALRGSVLTADPGMPAQTHPSQWTAHDLSTLLGDQDQGKPPQRRRAIRYALHFAAETPYGESSTLNLWAPHRVDPA